MKHNTLKSLVNRLQQNKKAAYSPGLLRVNAYAEEKSELQSGQIVYIPCLVLDSGDLAISYKNGVIITHKELETLANSNN